MKQDYLSPTPLLTVLEQEGEIIRRAILHHDPKWGQVGRLELVHVDHFEWAHLIWHPAGDRKPDLYLFNINTTEIPSLDPKRKLGYNTWSLEAIHPGFPLAEPFSLDQLHIVKDGVECTVPSDIIWGGVYYRRLFETGNRGKLTRTASRLYAGGNHDPWLNRVLRHFRGEENYIEQLRREQQERHETLEAAFGPDGRG